MGAVSASDPSAVAGAVAGWATERFAGAVEVVGTPAQVSGGLDSYIHRVELAGEALPGAWRRPLIVRLLPSPDRTAQAAREAAVQAWCAERGYPVPQVLAVLAPDEGLGLPTQVMELAPGGTMLQAVTSRPWRTYRLVDQLAGLALRLHALAVDGWPFADEPGTLVDQRLSLPRRVVDVVDPPGLSAALAHAEAAGAVAMEGPSVVCHGDFHPLNVVVAGPSAAVIDWTDAGLGPREADVARTLLLFHVASIAAEGAVERVALRAIGPRLARRYRRTYEAGAVLDPARMRRWELLHAVHGWAQVEMLHAGGFEGSSSADAASVPLEVAAFLRAKVEQLTAAT